MSPISNAGSGLKTKGPAKPFASNIPLPNHQQQTGTSSYISGWREKVSAGSVFGKDKKTRWDTYSGEPTDSDRGRMGSAVPGATPFDKPRGVPMGNISTISSSQTQKPSLFSSTLRKVGKKDAAPVQQREAWKGASGRETIVPPVTEKTDTSGKSKSFPTPSQRRKQQGFRQTQGLRQQLTGRGSPAQDPYSTATTQAIEGKRSVSREVENEATLAYSHTQEQHSRESSVSPYPPRLDGHLKLDSDEPEPGPLSHLDGKLPSASSPSPMIRDGPDVIVETPDRVDSPSRFASHGAPGFSESQLRNAVQHMGIRNEPASRFSATTYNTSVPDSPPGTPDPNKDDILPVPMPAPSILNRKRPVPTAGVNLGSKPPSRKPTPSDIGVQEKDLKDLPPAPAGQEHVDRVTQLEAKIASLQKRRANLNTVIHELTHVVQPSSIAYDMASRQEIKKTVEGLNTERSAVAKEIHETGLKLHRALKKRDEDSLYEPTGLWVRRVTE